MGIAVVMPAWNEARGITEFLTELNQELVGLDPTFVVVDDCSTDDSVAVLEALAQEGLPVRAFRNDVNSGHGPSTVRALRLGLELKPQAVVAIDGDGQFKGADVRRVVEALNVPGTDVVEGVRTSRHDPVYRRLVSAATRWLVWSRTRNFPGDANTPLRAYAPDVLAMLLDVVPVRSLTPNLMISALSRGWKLHVVELDVDSLPRRGGNAQGSTWGKGRKALPTKRFISFCAEAFNDWRKTSMSSRPQP